MIHQEHGCGQLVVTTQDISILKGPFRKDQFYIVSKVGGASLIRRVSTLDIKDEKRIYNDYIAGIYGSVPNKEELVSILESIYEI